MKTAILTLLSATLLTGTLASAGTSAVQCRDFKQRVLFTGFVRADGDLARAQDTGTLDFQDAVSAEPLFTLDRRTLQRKIGVVLPRCKGPYARVYARLGRGQMQCEYFDFKVRGDMKWTDENVLRLVLPKADVPCAVILPAPALKDLR